jgi:hypothetical protein
LRFEVVTAVLLNIEIFCNMPVLVLRVLSDVLKVHSAFIFRVKEAAKNKDTHYST